MAHPFMWKMCGLLCLIAVLLSHGGESDSEHPPKKVQIAEEVLCKTWH